MKQFQANKDNADEGIMEFSVLNRRMQGGNEVEVRKERAQILEDL